MGVCERGPASQSKGIGSRNEHGIAGFEQTRGTEPFDVRQGLIELDGGDQVVILLLLEPLVQVPQLCIAHVVWSWAAARFCFSRTTRGA